MTDDVKQISPKDRIYQCIVDIHSSGRVATREVIVRETGIKMSVVDEQFRRLREDGKIDKVVNGVYEPVTVWEERLVGASVLDDGRAALEVGDVKVIVTPTEARKIIKVLGGFALSFGR